MSSACPYCGEVAADGWAEKAHMEAKHPDVIAQRLVEAGIPDDRKPGDRLRKLAGDLDYYSERLSADPETRAEFERAVVELRVEVERLWMHADGPPRGRKARRLLSPLPGVDGQP